MNKMYALLVLFILTGIADCFFFKTVDSSLPECNLDTYAQELDFDNHFLLFFIISDSVSLPLNFTNCAYNKSLSKPVFLQLIYPDKTILSSGLSNIISFMDFLMTILYPFRLILASLDGIDLKFFSELKNSSIFFRTSTYFEITESLFNLYYQNQNLMTPEKCNQETYKTLLYNDGANVMSSFTGFTFNMLRSKDTAICKFLFYNVTLDIVEASNTHLRIIDSVESTNSELNASVSQLRLTSMFNINLDESILHKEVFKHMTVFEIQTSSVKRIQNDLFKNRFFNLKQIKLQVINIKGVLHGKDGTEWIKNINYDIHPTTLSKEEVIDRSLADIIIKRGLLILFELSNKNLSTGFFPYLTHEFPDTDFCLFHDFPFERLVFPQIYGLNQFSCTSAWLMQYENLYTLMNKRPFLLPKIPCNYTDMISKCQLRNGSVDFQSDQYFEMYYLANSIKKAKQILVGYIGSVISGFGFITNMLIVVTILYNHKRRNEIRTQPKNKSQEIVMLEQPLYKYILFNSVINSIYLFMYLLDYSITCTPIRLFDHGDERNCFFNNIILDMIGSFLKLISNFSFLQISLNRYLLVGKDHSERLTKIAQLKIKRFFIYSAIFSASLSVVVYFQKTFFIIQTTFNYKRDYYYEELAYHAYYWEKFADNYQKMIERINELPLLTAFTVVHDLFSFFLYCLLSLVIDILTVKKLHDALLEKAKLKGNQEKKKNRESERKSIMMVVLSSSTNIIFRAPEIVSIVFYYIVTHRGGYVFKMLCWTYASCLVFVDFANVFYMTSFCFNLFFYVKFNSVFKCSFDILVQNFVKKFQSDKNYK